MGFNTANNTLYIGDSNGNSKLIGAPLPLSIENGGTGSTTAANARSALGITPANIGAALSSHTHTLSQLTDWPGIETTLSGETDKLVTSQGIYWAIPRLVNSDKIEWNQTTGPDGRTEFWPSLIMADSLNGITPIQLVEVWSNDAPTSEFARQDVPIDMSSYWGALISFDHYNQWGICYAIGKKGDSLSSGAQYIFSTGEVVGRSFHVKEDRVSFYDGWINESDANKRMIPLFIYGIKGVID